MKTEEDTFNKLKGEYYTTVECYIDGATYGFTYDKANETGGTIILLSHEGVDNAGITDALCNMLIVFKKKEDLANYDDENFEVSGYKTPWQLSYVDKNTKKLINIEENIKTLPKNSCIENNIQLILNAL